MFIPFIQQHILYSVQVSDIHIYIRIYILLNEEKKQVSISEGTERSYRQDRITAITSPLFMFFFLIQYHALYLFYLPFIECLLYSLLIFSLFCNLCSYGFPFCIENARHSIVNDGKQSQQHKKKICNVDMPVPRRDEINLRPVILSNHMGDMYTTVVHANMLFLNSFQRKDIVFKFFLLHTKNQFSFLF